MDMVYTQKPPSLPKKATDTRPLTSKVVKRYRYRLGQKGKPLSYLKFANALIEPVSHLGISVTYQAIKFWEDGVHSPSFFLVQQIVNHASPTSWQYTFAREVMAVQWPELYRLRNQIGGVDSTCYR